MKTRFVGLHTITTNGARVWSRGTPAVMMLRRDRLPSGPEEQGCTGIGVTVLLSVPLLGGTAVSASTPSSAEQVVPIPHGLRAVDPGSRALSWMVPGSSVRDSCSTGQRLRFVRRRTRHRRDADIVEWSVLAHDLRRAYSIPTNGAQAAVTIVDAYANPRVAESLRVYETRFGLPHLPGCRAGANIPCFQYQNLAGSVTDDGWDEEGFLDIQMVRAACQTCSIRYVGTIE